MNYSRLSDFEINKLVTKSLGMAYAFWFSESEESLDIEIPTTARGPIWQTREHLVNGYRPSNGECFNPCNNPADAWPIILENGISLVCDHGEWIALAGVESQHGEADHFSHCYQGAPNHPFRAAMIVYLMTKEGKK